MTAVTPKSVVTSVLKKVRNLIKAVSSVSINE